MEMHKIIHTLKDNHEIFASMTDQEFLALLKCGESKSCKDDDFIFREGAKEDEIYIVVSGTVSIIKKRKEIDTVTAGECFGEMGAATGTRRSATAKAKGEVLLLVLNGDKMRSMNPELSSKIYRNLLTIVSERLRKRLEDI